MARLNLVSTGTPYVVIIDATGKWWNGLAFEAYDAGNWATYVVAATQYGSSDAWYVTFPAATPGNLDVLQFRQAGGSPAESDSMESGGTFKWDGTTLYPSLLTENAIADGLLDRSDAVESGVTPRQALRAFGAALAGILSGAAGTTVTIKGIGQAADGTTRITATVDANGNRSAVTLNL